MNFPNLSLFTKPICRFLIHRYMGQYLKTELTSGQLEFRLADGTASVQHVMLNTEYINEILDSVGLVSLVDGFVEEISLCVPWKKLMIESTIIKVSGLQLTMTPLMDVNMTNTQDLVSSMIGSIASSMDLARSVIADEQIADGADNAGVEQFASLIDQVISRIKIIFVNTTIRLEAYSDLCTGLEVQIDKMEFVDEQLEARQQQQNSGEPITQQPASLYTVTDLNKLLHLQGVRLYTDIWSPLKENRLSTSTRMSSQDELDPNTLGDMCTSSLNYQSCYSHMSSKSIYADANRQTPNSIPPNPVLFAQFFSEKQHTVRIRVNNAALSSADNCVYNKRVDIDIFFGGSMFFFLTPSQIALLMDLFAKLVPKKTEGNIASAAAFGGRPMRPEHFQKITDQFHGEVPWKNGVIGNGLVSWSGQDQFFEMSQGRSDHPTHSSSSVPTEHGFPTLRKSNSTDSADTHGNQRNHGSTITLVENQRRPDIFSLTLRTPTLVGVITHEDPLNSDNVKSRETMDSAAVRTITSEMLEQANAFFASAANMKIAKKRLDSQREMLAKLYPKDHLRIVATGTVLSLNLVNEIVQHTLLIEGSLEECDLVECLQPGSVAGDTCGKVQHFDLLNLSEHNLSASRDVFTFRISNSAERQQDFVIEFNMDTCKTDLDMSIVDRISHLLCTKPCFAKPSIVRVENEVNPGLSDNFLTDAINADVPSTYRLKFLASTWLINLRIPVADLSEESEPFWRRNVHKEYLVLNLQGAFLEMPKFLPADLSNHGNLILQCKSITSSFVGDLGFLECMREEMTFLHADSVSSKDCEDNHAVKIKLSYDTRNKALRTAGISLDDSGSKTICKSMYESFFKPRDEDCVEGPFSKASNYFADTRLIMAGSRDELIEFSEDCRLTTNFNIEFSMPHLNLCLPSHKFFEVIYNRFANDFALWEPKSPALKSLKAAADNNLLSPFDQQFVECQSYNFGNEIDNDYSDECHQRASSQNVGKKNKKSPASPSHLFSLTLRVTKARILLQTSVKNEPYHFISQIGSEVCDGEMFLVYGFHEDPNVTYFYTTATKSTIYHRNLLDGVQGFPKDVLDVHNFASRAKDDLHAEPVPKEEPCTLVNDDNFAVSLKIVLSPDDNMKDILIALALRNTLIHLKPFTDAKLFWGNQFADFFNVIDYGVPGYVLPIVKINLHVHLTSILLGYNHSSVVSSSPMQLRLEIGSCDITARLMAEMERFKFQCLLEDTKLWIRKKRKSHSVTFDIPRSHTQKISAQNDLAFVKVLFVGLLHFTLDYTIVTETFAGPLLDLVIVNDLVKIWVCSDTIVELTTILTEFLNSNEGKFLLTNSSAENEKEEQRKQQLVEMVNRSNMYSSVHSNISTQPQQPSTAGLPQRQFSADEENHLVKMMASAMQENPQSSLMSEAVKARRSQVKNPSLYPQIIEEYLDEEVDSPSETTGNSYSSPTNTDDEFIMIEKVPSTVGITRLNEPKFELDNFEIVSTHVKIPDSSSEENITNLPADHPPPILRYAVKDLSLCIYLYGGNDFGESLGMQKTYSQWDTRKDSNECMSAESEGGKFRDHTVCVEAKISKISILCEVFNATAPVLSLNFLKIGDIEVLDHLLVSEIHKLFYQHTNHEMPRRVSTPVLSVQMIEDQLREGKLKISVLPIRLNFDQDTLEFLQDFGASISQNVQIPELSSHSKGENVPIMEIPVYDKRASANVDIISNTQVSFSAASNRRLSTDVMEEFASPPNLDELFSEDDVNLSDSFCAGMQEPKSDDIFSEAEEMDETSQPMPCSSQATATNFSDMESSSRTNKTSNKPTTPSRDTFYKEFTFSPACRICLDYVGKRVKTEQGALVGLLIGLANLHRTELILKELHNEKGLLGFNKCLQHAVDEWVQDIRARQIPNVVGSYTPISALVHLAQGFRDLFAIPLNEFRKEDGHVVRGIQQGASNFGLSTATAAIDATQRLAYMVQGVAELAFDMVTPDYAYQQQRRQINASQRLRIAGDIREGLTMAYDTVREGVWDTAQTLQAAAQEDRACGSSNWGIRGILRHATPTAIKPIVIASQATVHVLGGLKNQLRPDDHREELDKWRRGGANLGLTHQPARQYETKQIPPTRKYEPPPPSKRRY
ncbi:autophagy-related protein 2 like protein B [Ditylenchus destructor]|nr:autophagy-related protein 2 like protein B [Ditylenchus destructor]